MRKLIWNASFKRAFKRQTRRQPALSERIFEVLAQLSAAPFGPELRTHKLRGELDGLWACWVEYDCRIVFAFEPDPENDEDALILVDIGTHDEVY